MHLVTQSSMARADLVHRFEERSGDAVVENILVFTVYGHPGCAL